MTKPRGTGRGGKRPGAGRKREPYKPRPIIDVAAWLADVPGGVAGRATRTVIALAAFNASDEVIAAALSMDVNSLRAVHAADLARGQAWMAGDISCELMRAA